MLHFFDLDDAFGSVYGKLIRHSLSRLKFRPDISVFFRTSFLILRAVMLLLTCLSGIRQTSDSKKAYSRVTLCHLLYFCLLYSYFEEKKCSKINLLVVPSTTQCISQFRSQMISISSSQIKEPIDVFRMKSLHGLSQ